jgi:hypothetical protein
LNSSKPISNSEDSRLSHSKYTHGQVFPFGEPDPIPNDLPGVWGLVQKDMRLRNKFGEDKYGTHLQPHNGRDALKDAYEESLDLCVYLRQALYERDGK